MGLPEKLNGTAIYKLYLPFKKHLRASGFRRLNRGSFREVYRRKNVVIKIPINVNGVIDNMMEAKAYRFYKNKPTSLGIVLAPARLLSNYCLMMPYVDQNLSDLEGPIPEWVEMVDADQVGIFKKRLVAYDYALDLQERYAWEIESNLKSDFFQGEWKHVKPFLYPPEALPIKRDDSPLQSLQPFEELVIAKRL